MQRKLTITMDEAVYDGLARLVGRGRISRFIEDLVRPHVLGEHIEEGYRAMAADAEREREAVEWINGIAGGKVLEMARELGMNVSQTVDAFLQEEVRRLYRAKWQAENRQAIADYNERVRLEGVFGDDVRGF